jgi:hypothetical protein
MRQAMLAPRRMRTQCVKFRTMQINGLRGLLADAGEVIMALQSILSVRTNASSLKREAFR